MNRTPGRRRILGSLLLLLVCVLLVWLPSSHPLYDATPNDGDETMSLSQAYNSIRVGAPAYGYTADGGRWTPGVAILPTYFAVYGPLAAAVAPLRRIPAARVLSRLLVGLALFLAASTLLRGRRRARGASGIEEALTPLAVASLVLLFSTAESFLLAGAIARVDALGLCCVALYGYAARGFLEERSERRLCLVGACAVIALFASYVAGALCALDAVALAVFHMVTPFQRRRLARTLAVGGAVLLGAACTYLLVHFVLLHGSTSRNENQAFVAETDLAQASLGNLSLRTILWHLTRFPGVLPLFALVLAGSALVAPAVLRGRGPEARFGLFLARLGMIACVTHLVSYRLVYAPLVLCAMVVPFLDTVTRVPAPVWRRAVVVVALPLVIYAFVPNALRRSPEAAQEQVVNVQLNARRDAHIASLFAFLDREHATGAITADPLLTVLDDDRHHFFFLYVAGLAGVREFDVLATFVKRFDVHYLVTTRFGDDGFVNYLGLRELRNWTASNRRGSTRLHYADGRVLLVEEVFESSGPDLPAGQDYRIGLNPACTPFYVYRLTLE